MKFKLFLMAIMLVVLSVTPMIYMGKIDPMAFFDTAGTKLAASVPKNLSSVVTDQKVEVYKWRDEHGVMQFSNTPPVGVTNAKQMVLDPNSNVIQAVKIPVKEEKAPEAAAQIKPTSPYSIKAMKKTMGDARNVEKLLQQRHQNQQDAFNKL